MGVAMDAMGLRMGARIAVASPNAARFLMLYYGVSGNGRIVVPINWRLKPDEVAWIVEHSGKHLPVVYDNQRQVIVTILPPTAACMEPFRHEWARVEDGDYGEGAGE